MVTISNMNLAVPGRVENKGKKVTLKTNKFAGKGVAPPLIKQSATNQSPPVC